MKNLTDSRKTVETGVDPRLATFLNFQLGVSRKLENYCLRLK